MMKDGIGREDAERPGTKRIVDRCAELIAVQVDAQVQVLARTRTAADKNLDCTGALGQVNENPSGENGDFGDSRAPAAPSPITRRPDDVVRLHPARAGRRRGRRRGDPARGSFPSWLVSPQHKCARFARHTCRLHYRGRRQDFCDARTSAVDWSGAVRIRVASNHGSPLPQRRAIRLVARRLEKGCKRRFPPGSAPPRIVAAPGRTKTKGRFMHLRRVGALVALALPLLFAGRWAMQSLAEEPARSPAGQSQAGLPSPSIGSGTSRYPARRPAADDAGAGFADDPAAGGIPHRVVRDRARRAAADRHDDRRAAGFRWPSYTYRVAAPNAPGSPRPDRDSRRFHGDGRADRRTVFWDRAYALTSVELGRGGVWALCPPQLLFIPDADGDDRPDGEPIVVLDGFEFGPANHHNFANGLKWGPDGWLYGRNGISNVGLVGPPGADPESRVVTPPGIWRYHPEQRTRDRQRQHDPPLGPDWDQHGGCSINTVIGHLWHSIPGTFRRMFGADLNHTYELIDQTADTIHWDVAEAGTKPEGLSPPPTGGGRMPAMIYQGEDWPAEYRDRCSR